MQECNRDGLERMSETEKKNESNVTHNIILWDVVKLHCAQLFDKADISLRWWFVMRGWGFIFSVRRLGEEELVRRVISFLFCFSYELGYLACVTVMAVNGHFQFSDVEKHNYSKATFFLELCFHAGCFCCDNFCPRLWFFPLLLFLCHFELF